jgi:hypothetical protein
MTIKPNTELEAKTDIELHAELALRIMVEFADLVLFFFEGWRKNGIHEHAEGELLHSMMGILDRACNVSTDGEPIWPLLGFRVGDGSDPEEVLLLPKTTNSIQDLVYPVIDMLKRRPDLRPKTDNGFLSSNLNREVLKEIDRLTLRSFAT